MRLLLSLAPLSALGAACPPALELRFPDGSQACLTDYAVAEQRANGSLGAMHRQIPSHGVYLLALPRRPGMCPRSLGLWTAPGSSAANFGVDESWGRWYCQRPLGRRPQGSACECQTVVNSGSSTLERAQWEALMKEAAEPESLALDASWRAGQPALAAAPATGEVPATAAPGPVQEPAPVAQAAEPTILQFVANLPAVQPAAAALVSEAAADRTAWREQGLALQSQVAQQALAALPSLLPVAARARPPARALVIGNGQYVHLGALPNPGNDARAIADKLRQFGIAVDLLLDADRPALVKALSDYQARAVEAEVNILFYAGHGLQVDGINYVVPVDMAVSGATSASVKLNAVSLNDALEYLPAHTRLVFLDACRDNPLSRSLRTTRGGSAAGLAPVNTSSGTLVAYATKDGATAEDGRGRNSPYTIALLQHLDADEDIAIVLRRVRQAVLTSTDKRQEPWEYGSLVGDRLVLSRLAR